jgi:hypothetical protein
VNNASAPTTALVTGWDRLAVIVLGGAGCALSASALMQMAIAIHIRPALCWLFPLVVDGFIAYGIRALLVLRTAPLRARLYVWTLVGTATGVSVWANALHAVRLNETAPAGGLQLGDTVVAYLSTVAPLALAGAVHLYILIARGPDNHSDRADRDRVGQPGRSDRHGQSDPARGIAVTAADRAGQRSPHAGQASAGQPVTAPTEPPRTTRNPTAPVTRSVTARPPPSRSPPARSPACRTLTGRSLPRRSVTASPAEPVTGALTWTPRSCWRSPGQRSGPRTS